MVSTAKLFSLVGKNVIVTGGTSGIGRTVADYLASAGANVAIISTKTDPSVKTANDISRDYGVKTVGIGCDVTDEFAVEHMVEQVANTIGTADILLNNAGINIMGGALDLNFSDWKRILDVNVNGVFLVARAFAKKLIAENKPGSVINMASISASIVNLPQSQTAYNTSKAAVLHLTETLAVEWVQYGIRVNAVSPGYVWTEMNHKIPEEMRNYWTNATPFGRFAKPDEIAGAVIYFASDASTYTSGSEIIIDGGFTCL
jgi:NAD(P)-dependent dehydrogenase (short-subunit alcohol dehydrogenase family)